MKKFDRNKHAAHLSPAQWYEFERQEAEAESIARSWPEGHKRFGYTTAEVFTDPDEWLNWKLFQIAEECARMDGMTTDEKGHVLVEAAGRYFHLRTLKRIANAARTSVAEVVAFIDYDWPDLEQHREWIANATIRDIEGWVIAGR